jgi:hypothetical protein
VSLIQVDGDGIITTRLHWDEHDESLHVERVQDVEPVLEMVKAMRTHGFDGYNADRSMQATHVLPITVLEQWQREGVEWWNRDHDGELRRRANDPALNGFRIEQKQANGGRIIVTGVR